MRKAFYDAPEYREKQRLSTRQSWARGVFRTRRHALKTCVGPNCDNTFSTIPSDPKKFCSRSCAARVNNSRRTLSDVTKNKIATSLLGRPNVYRGVIKFERLKGICQNPQCGHQMIFERWRARKFCSNACAMAVIGGKPTSPRAARAKAGVRTDLGDFYFYSRWEANFARVLNFFGVRWQYQPKTFDLGGQRYTPDFYLPEYDMFVEIKNFLSPFSEDRDRRFRERYPHAQLFLLLKDDYLVFESELATKVQNWEYST